MSILKRIAATLLVLILGIAASAFAFVKLVEHRSAAHAYAPHLGMHAQPAPDLNFSTLDGQPRTLADSRGKVVIVNLWGTWCLPCIAEMGSFQRLYDHFRNDPRVTFLMIANRDTSASVQAFAQRYHLDLPFYLMDDSAMPYQVQSIPSTFFFLPGGSLIERQTGPAAWDDPTVIAFIDRLKRD